MLKDDIGFGNTRYKDLDDLLTAARFVLTLNEVSAQRPDLYRELQQELNHATSPVYDSTLGYAKLADAVERAVTFFDLDKFVRNADPTRAMLAVNGWSSPRELHDAMALVVLSLPSTAGVVRKEANLLIAQCQKCFDDGLPLPHVLVRNMVAVFDDMRAVLLPETVLDVSIDEVFNDV